ncbi:MAG: hypothetical protein IT458_05095 [Planctomycetes bacterium]|nr:hypothetical protein [Planctomycetota bacterium]
MRIAAITVLASVSTLLAALVPTPGAARIQDAPASRPATQDGAPDPGTMHTYWLGLLKAGEKRAESLPKDRLDELQRGHMAHIQAMARSGKLVLAGPMLDRPGGDPLIGVFLFDVKDRAEAEALAAQDPLVQAGRLRLELGRWYGPKWLLERRPKY